MAKRNKSNRKPKTPVCIRRAWGVCDPAMGHLIGLAWDSRSKAEALIARWESTGGFAKGTFKIIRVRMIAESEYRKLVATARQLQACASSA